jgi:antirestriction protein ArdC
VLALATADGWRSWLETQSRLHQYTFLNTVLIHNQRPGVTWLASTRSWKAMERYVRRGEKGIRIVSPVIRHARMSSEGGSDKRSVLGFRTVTVFDVSQTKGRPLQTPVSLSQSWGEGDLYRRLVKVAVSNGLFVKHESYSDRRRPESWLAEHLIRKPTRNDAQQLVKLLAHDILHAGAEEAAVEELEAESVAFVVCWNRGVRSDDYSFASLATWSLDAIEAIQAIAVIGGRVQQAAEQIICALAQD